MHGARAPPDHHLLLLKTHTGQGIATNLECVRMGMDSGRRHRVRPHPCCALLYQIKQPAGQGVATNLERMSTCMHIRIRRYTMA